MTLRDRLRGAAVHALLGSGVANVRRRAHRLLRFGPRKLALFWQADDPYSFLLAQLGQALLAAEPALALELWVVPPGGLEVDPEPALRRRFTTVDAAELGRHYALDWPAGATEAPPSAVALAERALLIARPARDQLETALAFGRALFTGNEHEVAALAARAGTVPATARPGLLEQNARRLEGAGHYHGGTFAFEGECYAGVDRFAHLEERLAADGLAAPVLRKREPATPPPRARGNELEMFFSFRSPYSYLALGRAAALARRWDVPLRIKPVLPMVMRGLAVPLRKRWYILRDARREADRLGIPFGRACDPLGAGVERCLALFFWASEHGRALAFVESAARGIWSEALNVARDDDLRVIVERAGSSWADAAARLRDERWRESVATHARELADLGLWGVPSFRFGEFATWGQDRFFALEARLSARAS